MTNDLIDKTLLKVYDKKLKTMASLLQRSYAYNLGDVVTCNGMTLKCTQAGTTNTANIANLDSAEVGDSITDGTVTWLVIDPLSTVIKDWQASTKYLVGNFVIKNDVLYECITANTDATFNPAKWKAISKDSLSAWESNKEYDTSSVVIYANNLYKCKTAHTSTSAFDVTKWDILSTKFLVNEYSDYGYLHENEVLTHEGVLFKANKSFTSSADMSQENNNLDFVYANIAPWKTATYYRQGSLVINNGCIYQCNTSHTSGAINNYKNLYVGNGMIKYAHNETVSEHIFDLGDVYHIKWIAGIKSFNGASINEFSAYVGDGNSWQLIGTCDTARDTEGYTIQFYPDITKSGRYLKLTLDSYQEDGTNSAFVAEFLNFRIDADLSYYWTPLSGYPEYIYGAEYKRHDMVTHGTKIYKCIVDRASSTFVVNEWEEISASVDGESIKTWVGGKEYSAGTIVLQQNRLYRNANVVPSSVISFSRNDWTPLSPVMEDWTSNREYKIGDFVIRNSVLYKCITDNNDATFNSAKWEPISKEGLNVWQSNKQYPLYATVVENEEVYLCIVAHTSSNTFKDDLDAHKWKLIGGGSSSGGNLEQITKLNVVAPLNVDIPIPYTDTFSRPPVEVLKYTQGTTNITTNALTFSAGDGSKFEIGGVTAKDSQLITFDGVVKPNHDITYPFNTPTLMTSKYYSESEEIDLSDYKVVEEVSLE